ncbi:MAG: CZB domain-containing protein, partial [Treponema porcinum]|nr:CZB domain-containing protein [Treponema porcinum]
NIILKHLSWVTKVRALIDGKLSGEGISLGDHHACDLGKWIDTQAESLGLSEKPSFKALVESHEALHSVVHDVFNNLETLSLSEREDRYATLLKKSQAVIDNLVVIRSELKTA